MIWSRNVPHADGCDFYGWLAVWDDRAYCIHCNTTTELK